MLETALFCAVGCGRRYRLEPTCIRALLLLSCSKQALRRADDPFSHPRNLFPSNHPWLQEAKRERNCRVECAFGMDSSRMDRCTHLEPSRRSARTDDRASAAAQTTTYLVR
jgi:hypothetical protein